MQESRVLVSAWAIYSLSQFKHHVVVFAVAVKLTDCHKTLFGIIAHGPVVISLNTTPQRHSLNTNRFHIGQNKPKQPISNTMPLPGIGYRRRKCTVSFGTQRQTIFTKTQPVALDVPNFHDRIRHSSCRFRVERDVATVGISLFIHANQRLEIEWMRAEFVAGFGTKLAQIDRQRIEISERESAKNTISASIRGTSETAENRVSASPKTRFCLLWLRQTSSTTAWHHRPIAESRPARQVRR